jgi:DNA replication and repair protein RecF
MLSELKLRHMRCFEGLTCELGEGTTVFLGDNAQGKTSILEAVCILLRLQSPRTSSLGEVIRFEERSFAVEGMLGSGNRLQIGYSKARRKLVVDGETQKRAGDYLRHSGLVVWMANDDLELVRGGGERRRRFLDFLGAQLFPAYRPALKIYEKALRSRNYLLKDPAVDDRRIAAYTDLLVEHGETLQRLRHEMVDALGPLAAKNQRGISDRDEELGLEYQPGLGNGALELDEEAGLAEMFERAREEDRRRRQTTVGPHRDDVALMVQGRPASSFASEGQQRTVALALKLGQAELLRERREEEPILLVDDIFGELDPQRRNALMAAFPMEAQKLVTTTHLDWLDGGVTPQRVFTGGDGAIAIH